MALTDIQKIRLMVQDNNPGLYLISDDEIQFFLDRNSNNIDRTSIEVARVILFNLSINSNDDTVDIFSIKGSKAASAYKEALMLYIKNNALNPINQTLSGYVDGVYIDDMQANDADLNNNLVPNPSTDPLLGVTTRSSDDYFSV